MKIYKLTDRIKVKLNDDVVLHISPLSFEHKSEITSLLLKYQQEQDIKHVLRASKLACKYALKDIEGCTLADGSKYNLKANDGVLEDSCVDELANSEYGDKIFTSCMAFLNGVPTDIKDQNGKKLKGVEIISSPLEQKSQ